MRHAVSLLLALASLGAPALAGDADVVVLDSPKIVASPGTPEALHPHLPRGARPEPIAGLLPDGPIVILGLPDEDPVAHDLALAFNLLPADGDLHGGYVVAAWHDGHRPMAVVLGADPVALRVAAEELGLFGSRTARVPAGWRVARSRFRTRGLLGSWTGKTDLATAIAGGANRFYVDVMAHRSREAGNPFRKLRRSGISPALLVRLGPDADPRWVAELTSRWRRDHGVGHFALSAGPDRLGAKGLGAEGIGRIVRALRASGPVEEIVLLPDGSGGWQDGTGPATIRGTQRAFLETWAEANLTPVPSRPRGRPANLAQTHEAMVVVPGPGAKAMLRAAWRGKRRGREDWERVLLPLLPRGAKGPRAFLKEAADGIDRGAETSPGPATWLAPLAAQIRRVLPDVGDDAVVVPYVPTPIRADGRLNEPAWSWAAPFEIRLESGHRLRALAIADGRRIALGVRAPPDLETYALRVQPLPADPFCFTVFGGPPPHPAPRPAHANAADDWAESRSNDAFTSEITLDHYALRGDAHPTRVFRLSVWDERAGRERHVATLVLGP